MLNLYRSQSQWFLRSLPHIVLQIMIHIIPSAAVGTCNEWLLSDRVRVPDTAFEHSSAVNLQHGAAAARNLSLHERAWCPDALIHNESREFLQIDLGRQSVIKLIITKGRVAQSKGRQTTPYFYVRYQRERTGVWFNYRKENRTQLLTGNQDAMTEMFNTMEPSIVARYIQIYPFNFKPIETCLKLELIGCSANGVVEYQAPQGSVLSPKRTRQYRFLDTSYDSPYPSTDVLRGGLGKLTDGDVELLSGVDPLSSFKYVGWKRQSDFLRGRRQPQYQHQAYESSSYTTLVSKRRDRSLADDHIRILFRFDNVYNFTQIRLFVANDSRNGIACPKNITVRFGIVEDMSEQVYLFNPEFDRSNWSSRWISLTMSTNPTVSDAEDIRYVHPKIPPVSKEDTRYSKHQLPAIGRFIELKLFFDLEWIVLGEVAFENLKVDEKTLQTKEYQVKSETVKTAVPRASTTTELPTKSNFLLESTLTQGQPTTFTLIAICGVLAILIVIGLLCLFGMWRQKRLRTSFEGRFHRGKKHANGSSQFDCLNAPQLLNSHLANHNSLSGDHQKNVTLLDMQTKFQHPLQCHQDLVKTVPNSPAFLPGLQLYSNTLGPNYSLNCTQPSPGILVNMDPNIPNSVTCNGPLVSSAPTPTSVTNGLAQPSEIIHFLPLSTSQVRCLTNYTSGQMGSNDPYRTFVPDNAIYTTLPESDCDSQPYARVGNGGSIHGLTNGPMQDLPRLPPNYTDGRLLDMGQTNFLSGQAEANMLLSGGGFPPPPSLPLPPLPPQHFSPSPSQGSASLIADEFADSGAPLMSNDVKEQNARYLPPSTLTTHLLPMNNQAFPSLNFTEQMMARNLSNFQTLPGSDYSNTTMGSSNNAYGAYYGATGMYAATHRTLGTAHHPLQIRR